MAGASMKDIKLRIRSVENTMQITKAMQLVASSKLRGARRRMEDSRPYLETARQVISEIAAHNTGSVSAFLTPREVKRRCVVVIAGDRGLAGSYNANVFKAAGELFNVETCVLPIGRKAKERYVRGDCRLIDSDIQKVDGLTAKQCEPVARELMRGFKAGEYDEVCLVYTTFVSVLTQKPRVARLLPVEHGESERMGRQMIFEPGVDALLNRFLPEYLAGAIYAAACDSVASEQAARRVAMDSATKNAGEMIEDLSLRYNRARQGSITQEITEIVAGSEH